MNSIRRTVSRLGERSSEGLVKKTYTIEASPNVIANLERFLSHVQYCSGVGHSALVGMSIDGDGADRFRVISPDLPKVKEEDVTDREARVETVRYSD